MMIGSVLAAAVLFAQAVPAVAPQAPPEEIVPVDVSPKTPGFNVTTVTIQGRKSAYQDGKTIQCHAEVVVGSALPRKICARREEIAERTREDQELVREIQAAPISTKSK